MFTDSIGIQLLRVDQMLFNQNIQFFTFLFHLNAIRKTHFQHSMTDEVNLTDAKRRNPSPANTLHRLHRTCSVYRCDSYERLEHYIVKKSLKTFRLITIDNLFDYIYLCDAMRE